MGPQQLMGSGVWLGVDVGRVRVGVARCDPEGIMALPVETLRRDEDGADVRRCLQLVRRYSARAVVVGLPIHLSGAAGSAVADALTWARSLAALAGPDLPIRLLDERLTTVTAHAHLNASGRGSRRHRSVVDQQAAVVILNQALSIMHHSGNMAGIDLATYPIQEDAAGE